MYGKSDTENLKEGEMICSKCEGMGEYSYNEDVAIWCSKCQGTGKVDWLENIVGKKTEIDYFDAKYHGSSHDDAVDAMAKQFAKDIDKEILESILQSAEQTNNIMKTAKIIMFEMEGS